MPGTDRRTDLVTTDLLDVWTDADTAMEAVGNSLGIFGERIASPRRVLDSDSRLRSSLNDVLLSLVDGGALEMRPCGSGRYAFRWRADMADAAVSSPEEEMAARLERYAAPSRAASPPPSPAAPLPALAGPPAPASSPSAPELADASPDDHARPRARPLDQAPLLALPAVSCVLAILAFVFLDQPAALAVTALLAIVGIVGLVRRVPFAGTWMFGVLIAGVLVHFS